MVYDDVSGDDSAAVRDCDRKRPENEKSFAVEHSCDMGRVWDAKVFCAAAFSGIGCLFLGSLTILVGYLLEWGLHFFGFRSARLRAQMLAIVLIWIGFYGWYLLDCF